MFDVLIKRLRYGYFLQDKQLVFLEDLSTLIEDGVSVTQAVETIRQVSDGMIERMATHIAHCLAQGKPLADGMQGWFSRPLVEVIRAGEDNGTLDHALQAASNSYSRQTSVAKDFFHTVAYPIVVLVASFLIVVFIRHTVLDSFAMIRPIAEWPDVGQSLYHLGFLVEHWWWLAIILVVFAIFLISRMLQQFTGDIRVQFDGLPLISLYRDMIAARFMETLGLLISNGMVLKKALSIMHREAAPYLSWHILKMELKLSSGKENIAEVFDTQLIKRHDIVRLLTVTKSRGLEHALINLGQQAGKRAVRSIVNVGKISGGILLFLGALMAVVMVFGIYAVGSVIATY